SSLVCRQGLQIRFPRPLTHPAGPIPAERLLPSPRKCDLSLPDRSGPGRPGRDVPPRPYLEPAAQISDPCLPTYCPPIADCHFPISDFRVELKINSSQREIGNRHLAIGNEITSFFRDS